MFSRFNVKVPPKIKKYFKDNPGAPLVIGFQLLLVLCAVLLIQGSSAIANKVAIYAYFLLVVGVALQLIGYIKHRRDAKEQDDD